MAVVNSRGKASIKDGPSCKFRCFSASQEALLPVVRNSRRHNMESLKGLTTPQMVDAILSSLPKKAKIVRLHVAGDFYSLAYLHAWLEVARRRPNIGFYAYTKSLHFVQKILPLCSNARLSRGQLTPNFKVTASRGGKYDHLIEVLNIREAKVIFDPSETNLEIDDNDSHAATLGGSFALMIHGVQPAGSIGAKIHYATKIKKSA